MDQVSPWRNESCVFFGAARCETISSSVVDDHPDRVTVRDIKRERTCVYDVVRTHTWNIVDLRKVLTTVQIGSCANSIVQRPERPE